MKEERARELGLIPEPGSSAAAVADGARMVFFVLETNTNERGKYNALIAVEGEQGYHRTDWFWGTDLALAEKFAGDRNEMAGISKDEASKIIASTMREIVYNCG